MNRARRIEKELAEQARWRPRAPFAGERLFERLLRDEFLDEEARAAAVRASLARMLGHALREVPFWQTLAEREGLDSATLAAPGGLARLPLLGKDEVRRQAAGLRARHLPPGEVIAGSTRTSGTTGQPLEVLHTARSLGCHAILRQRQSRWFRMDPRGCFARVQPAGDLARQPDGGELPSGVTQRRDGWHHVGRLFETGPGVALAELTPIEQQLQWLRLERPDYLLAQSGFLEHLALASAGSPAPGLRGLVGISQTMTASMREAVARLLRAPLHMVYGLNELGIVAATCAEGGRYHVHDEHFVVEILDGSGRPCDDGETGRLVVSSLDNTAMPLLRYDTDDFATRVQGSCACGRTLPAFVEVRGRYRRLAQLPAGTYAHWMSLQGAINDMPERLLEPLRQYQLYQRRDRGCELRLVVSGPLDPLFEGCVRQAWLAADTSSDAVLDLELRTDLPVARAASGKVESLMSEFYPPPDA